jgi:hypothetical protein
MPIDNFAEFAKPRLLDQVRIAIRTRHYSTATGKMGTHTISCSSLDRASLCD